MGGRRYFGFATICGSTITPRYARLAEALHGNR
jgi:hypothetical protein